MANLKNLTLGVSIALAGILLPASLYAGTDAKATVAPTPSPTVTGDYGVNIVNEYITRGAPQEIKGFIAQPYADLAVSVFEGDGFINKVTLNLGLWSSFHSKDTAARDPKGTWSSWYEFDYCPGFAVTFAKNFTLTTSYFEFDSPSNAFNPSRNLNFNLAYNDADLLGAFALHPHITYMRELAGKATNGPVGKEGNYYEAGVAPGLPAYGPVTITFPLTAGFGTNNFYYSDHAFGYFSGGVNAAIALNFIPTKLGTWSANIGATYYRLSSQNAWVYSPDNTIDKNRYVFQGGIGATF